MTFEGMALCCCPDDCWRQADPCICSEKEPPVYVPCDVADPLLVPDGDFAFEFMGECFLVTLASPIVDVLPPRAIEIPEIVAPLDDCFDCCDCFKLATLCACVEGPCPLVAVPCQVVTEDVVFEPTPGCCYQIGPASQEVLELPPDYILVGLVNVVPECAECCAPFTCSDCAPCQPLIGMSSNFDTSGSGCPFPINSGPISTNVSNSAAGCNWTVVAPQICVGNIGPLSCNWLSCGASILCDHPALPGVWRALIAAAVNNEFPKGVCSDAGLCLWVTQAIWAGSLIFACPRQVPAWIFVSGFGMVNTPVLILT